MNKNKKQPNEDTKIIDTTIGNLISAIAEAAQESRIDDTELNLYISVVLRRLVKQQDYSLEIHK